MLNKKLGIAILIAVAMGLWSSASFATVVNVGGVQWDTDHDLDFNIQSLNLRENQIDNVGDVLQGYGQVGAINNNTSFCSGCDLNFVFSYTVKAIAVDQVVLDNGSIDFYLAGAGSFDVTDPTTAGAGTGTLWLSLTGHEAPYVGFGSVGELYTDITGPVSEPENGSSGFGLLDVAGGLAASYVDTNGEADGADFTLNSAFQTAPLSSCAVASNDPTSGCYYPVGGQAGLVGDSVAVPAPSVLGLMSFGLVLLGLGFVVERRRKYDV